MAKVPPIEEREFLKLTKNHSEFRCKIRVENENLGRRHAGDPRQRLLGNDHR